ncbi:MAG TPA: cytochrome c oxidase subunit 3 [Gaiellaceae bacterium]|nr:cytochrome c oxidase subunit 3 [Gaiellaceae bacterium]
MSASDYVAGGKSERLVPRTTDARNAREASALARRRHGPSPAMWGMAMLVATEATLFGAFIGTYYYLRFKSPQWPPVGTPEPRVVVPLILVGVLATTSVPMQLAAFAARAGRLAATRAFLALALVVQCGYFAYEIHDLVDQLHRSQPQDNAYSSIYYMLLGADHAHVAVGLLLNLWLLGKLTTGLTMYRLNATQVIAFYWHAVNLLTLLVIGTLLSASV